jgi:hypothetical protein
MGLGGTSVVGEGSELGVRHAHLVIRLAEGSGCVAVAYEVVAFGDEGVGGGVGEVHVGALVGGDDAREHLRARVGLPKARHPASLAARGGVFGYGGVLYNAEAGEVDDAAARVRSGVGAYGGVGDGGFLRAGEEGVGKGAAAEAGRVAGDGGVADRQDAFTVVDAAAG